MRLLLLLLPLGLALCPGIALGDDEPGALDRWEALTAQAQSHQAAGRFAKADDCYARAADVARDEGLGGDHETESLYRRYGCLRRLGDYPSIRDVSIRVLGVLRAVLAEARMGEEPEAISEAGRRVANTLMDLGYVQTMLGDFRDAVERLEEALVISEDRGDEAEIADALARLANAEHARGRYGPAQVAAEEAERIFRALDEPQRLIETLVVLGNVYLRLNDAPRARAAYEEARALLEKETDPLLLNRGDVARRLGLLHLKAGRYDDAVEAMETSRALYQRAGSRRAVLLAQIYLANVELRLGSPEKALALLDHDALTEGPPDNLHTQAALERGDALRRLGRPEAAIEELRRAVELSRHLASIRLECRAWESLAHAQLTMGATDGATTSVIHSLDLIDRMAERMTPLGELSVQDDRSYLFHLAARIGMAHEDDEAAYALVERARATALVQHLGGAEGAAAYAPPAAQAAIRGARDALSRARQRLEAVDPGAPGSVRKGRAASKAFTAARDAYADALERGRRLALFGPRGAAASPPGAAGEVPRAPPRQDIAALRAHLGDGQAFVLYASAASTLEALLVTRAGVERRTLGETDTVRAAIDELATEMEDARRRSERGEILTADETPSDALQQLRKCLIARLRLPDGVTRLVLSPDRGMGSLPFSLLVDGDLDVALVPSGTAWLLLARTGDRRGTGVLGLGDPVYPSLHGDAPPRRLALVRSPRRLFHLGELPGTRAEVEAITGPDDVRLLGRSASEDLLLAHLASRPRWRAVHLACHGICDPVRPEWSSLALTPTERSDGFLSVLEILGLRVHADAVVLSACETGLGVEMGGEGLLSLATAFLNAGSPRVLASLWKVDSEATSVLMKRFHALWSPKEKEGLPAAEALRRAQQELRSRDDGRWAHPYYWAGWVLWGLPD